MFINIGKIAPFANPIIKTLTATNHIDCASCNNRYDPAKNNKITGTNAFLNHSLSDVSIIPAINTASKERAVT
ncbi:hypothetical protein PghCCS26_41860 [Paenibacillus glycanilyticus]|uniref:Uncharacterized protein n=1 Tax=Paenibacillus glycanilyticus TaxID=126569 RepID=A0ABQ6NSE5_9BACL|nr:hypothetical protein PghCCS26_41860 [Paenibacillus glycanilyticus]